MHILDYSKTKYCNLIGQLQVSKSYRKQTWDQLHLNVINYYYYYTIAYPITITIILHIKITLLYYYYYYNAINYYYFVVFQLIFENINASLKYNYCI